MYIDGKKTLHAKCSMNYSEGNEISDSSLNNHVYSLANMPCQQISINSNNPDALFKVLVQLVFVTKFYCSVSFAHQYIPSDNLFVFVALRPMSTAMVIAGRSVHLGRYTSDNILLLFLFCKRETFWPQCLCAQLLLLFYIDLF